jgi:hypothetical protein
MKKGIVNKLLFDLRAATAEQLTLLAYPHLLESRYTGYPQKNTMWKAPSQQTNLYPILKELTRKKLVASYHSEEKNASVFYLTSSGLEAFYEENDIPTGYRGTGFNNDYGWFPYDLFRPPLKFTAHHLSGIDFVILMLSNLLNERVQIRHNLYSVIKAIEPTFQQSLKPDYHLIVNDFHKYFVEIDMKTERGDDIPQKFKQYSQAYSYNPNITDHSILFIVPPSKHESYRRWNEVSLSFIKHMGRFATNVDLVYSTLNRIKRSTFFPEENIKKLTNLKYYFSERDRNVKIDYKHKDKIEGDFSWTIPQFYFWTEKTSEKNIKFALFIPIVIEKYKTKGIARFLKLCSVVKKDSFYKNVIPVLCYENEMPRLPRLEALPEWEEIKDIISMAFFVDITEDPVFFELNGEQIGGNAFRDRFERMIHD